MLFSTLGQIYVFAWMVGAGFIIGALYTLCSALRHLLEAGFWLTLTIDILFGIAAAVTLLAALITASFGQLRLYELLGIALGILLFQIILNPLLRRTALSLCALTKRVCDKAAQFRLIKVIFK